MTTSVRIGSRNKYGPIWKKLKEHPYYCRIECPSTKSVITVMNGVKKEKAQDKNKPEGKRLDIEVNGLVVIFKLVTDTSINNL